MRLRSSRANQCSVTDPTCTPPQSSFLAIFITILFLHNLFPLMQSSKWVHQGTKCLTQLLQCLLQPDKLLPSYILFICIQNLTKNFMFNWKETAYIFTGRPKSMASDFWRSTVRPAKAATCIKLNAHSSILCDQLKFHCFGTWILSSHSPHCKKYRAYDRFV